MSERWEEARADLEEERRRALAAGEVLPVLEDSTVTGLPFTPSRYPVETWRLLDEWHPEGKAPWTRVQCSIGGRWHDTGAEMRLKRHDNARWWIEVRQGRKHRPVQTVVPETDDADAAAPLRWEIECRECGKPTRRDPEFLDDAMLRALEDYRHRREIAAAQGRRPWPPQVHWSATTT
ncbi:MAG: hypothetical protein ACTMH5_07710 [Brachybacterium sp.]|uniref:hypothetical protein n=1 Tax=Brachybacterium sp. TaxID=1891286 RepID=UPI003F93B948